jgi:asparagine synthase (glutamine-hydrolysing)
LCGITGFTHKTHIPDRSRILSAVNSLVHRGPDHQGVFEAAGISLGATRLTILDIAAGDQPMSTADGRTTIAFNGEIYNFRELRSELEGLGHRFTTRTDTEVLLHAFVEWDTRCFARLRGMFAVALWSEPERRLVLARDRFGIKPLYFAKLGGDVYFGSELKTLFVHPEIERRLDAASLDCYLGLNYVPGPGTFVEGIEKLTPGSWLEWRNGTTRSESYWQLPIPSPSPMDFEEAKQRLDVLLESSVREHLIADVPLGLWLSGGIDSSTILHYAAGAAGRPINTFSVTFKGRSFDESSYIRSLVDQYGTRHEELDLNPELELRDAIEDFASYADEPNADAGALPVWYLSQMTRRSATVALSGEGADELFGGYVTYRANDLARWARRLPRPLLSGLARVVQAWPASDEKISLEYKLKRFLEGCLMRPERAHIYWNGTFSDAEKQALVRKPMPAALDRILAQLAQAGDNQGAYLWFDQKYYLTDDILAKVDRMSMAHSIEVRPPFLDHRIAEFAATLPNQFKIDGSRQKVLLRSLMRPRLPSPILRHSKIGFDIPAHEWLRGPLRELMLDTLAWGTAEHSDLFDAAGVQACVDAHLSRRANYGYHLWGLTILFLWMKKWRIRTAATPAADRKLAAISS